MAVVQVQGVGIGLGEKQNGKPFHATIRRPLGLRATVATNVQQQVNVQQQKAKMSLAIPIPKQPTCHAVHKAHEEIQPMATTTEANVLEVLGSTGDQTDDLSRDQLPDAKWQAHNSTPHPTACQAENEDMETDTNAIDVTEMMDKEDPSFCLEYAKDIYDYLRVLEVQYQVREDFMKAQHFIHPHMRSTVVDWMVCVQVKFRLLQETFLLSVAILDRFLAVHPVLKEELQLVGVTALLMASKYEEVYALQVSDLVYVTDNTYTVENICTMEALMLRTLDYFLGTPTALSFLRWYSRVAQLSVLAYTMTKFLTELGTTQHTVHCYLPSLLAAAAICLSTKLVQEDSCRWTTHLENFIGYTDCDLQPCMSWLSRQVLAMPTFKQQAVRKKYSDTSLMGVARMASLWGPAVRTMSRQWR